MAYNAAWDLFRCFRFERSGYGHYRVRYQCPKRGDYWCATIDDMSLIDATRNAEAPKMKDLVRLRQKVQERGTHYSKYNKDITT